MGGICGIEYIKGYISSIGSLQGALSMPSSGSIDYTVYDGEYTITPIDRIQVLSTANKLLMHDIIVEANSGGLLPDGSELATDDDIDGLINGVFEMGGTHYGRHY